MQSAKVTEFVRARPSASGRSRPPGRPGWRHACAGLLFAAAFSCIAQDGNPPAKPSPGAETAAQTPAAAPATAQAGNGAKQTKQQKAAAADNDRKKQISDESTQLLAMAVALKAEVDKTNKDTLSLKVIRKADEIEKLARTVKEKMKQSSGPS
jgi:hypothetical protein